jgi:RNA polymerase sigma factor (sigma-70 family)
MTNAAAPSVIAAARALEAVMRNDRGRLMAALISRLRNFQLAEDALQEATISALSHWGRTGLPTSPQGWLLKVAMRKAIDRLRSAKRETTKAADLAILAEEEASDVTPELIPDERLRLIFTCCHPALEPKSRTALTLRTLGGLTTPEIARAFLDTDTTMGQRLSRAKSKIAAAGIPFVVPGPEDWPDRLNSVLVVIYLIFNAGYTGGPVEARDLCEEAIFLARMVNQLREAEPEVEGCLALMLLTHARKSARMDAGGLTVPLAEQDRARWDHALLTQGHAVLDVALTRGKPGPFQIKAAIAACHGVDGSDWPQIMLLYDALLRHEPTPIVALNRAVAVAEVRGPQAGLTVLEVLSAPLAEYQPYYAALADLLARAGRGNESLAAYARAIDMAPSLADARFLTQRRDRLLNG